MQLKHNLKPKVHIDITPLVDVVFILLIFFMVTSTFLELPGMKLDLPVSQSARGQSAKQLTLFLTREGKILLGEEAVSLKQLPQRLQVAMKKQGAKGALVIKGDKEVAYGRVVRVMDIAKAAGVQKLVIATRFPPPGGADGE